MSACKEILICWSETKWKCRLGVQVGPESNSWLIQDSIQAWNPKSMNSSTQNCNNAGIIPSTTNSSRWSPLWENTDQVSENQEENKSLYPNCVLVIQGLLTLLYWNRNNNHSVWFVKHLAPLNTLSWNVKPSHPSESDFSSLIGWVTCSRTSTWITFCPFWKRQGCTKKKDDELKLFNLVQANAILLV